MTPQEPNAPAAKPSRIRGFFAWFDRQSQDTKIMLGFAGSIIGVALIVVGYLLLSAILAIISTYFMWILGAVCVLVGLFLVAVIGSTASTPGSGQAKPPGAAFSGHL